MAWTASVRWMALCVSLIRYLKIDFLILFGVTVFECLIFYGCLILFLWVSYSLCYFLWVSYSLLSANDELHLQFCISIFVIWSFLLKNTLFLFYWILFEMLPVFSVDNPLTHFYYQIEPVIVTEVLSVSVQVIFH